VEFDRQSYLSARFVDSTLVWANGLAGKIDRLLAPLTHGTKRAKPVVQLKNLASEINSTGNAIVHRGEFRDEDEATEAIGKTRRFNEGRVQLYEPCFKLRRRKGMRASW
jgi:hypothetical protein